MFNVQNLLVQSLLLLDLQYNCSIRWTGKIIESLAIIYMTAKT